TLLLGRKSSVRICHSPIEFRWSCRRRLTLIIGLAEPQWKVISHQSPRVMRGTSFPTDMQSGKCPYSNVHSLRHICINTARTGFAIERHRCQLVSWRVLILLPTGARVTSVAPIAGDPNRRPPAEAAEEAPPHL